MTKNKKKFWVYNIDKVNINISYINTYYHLKDGPIPTPTKYKAHNACKELHVKAPLLENPPFHGHIYPCLALPPIQQCQHFDSLHVLLAPPWPALINQDLIQINIFPSTRYICIMNFFLGLTLHHHV
jgi:hypothetical protein